MANYTNPGNFGSPENINNISTWFTFLRKAVRANLNHTQELPLDSLMSKDTDLLEWTEIPSQEFEVEEPENVEPDPLVTMAGAVEEYTPISKSIEEERTRRYIALLIIGLCGIYMLLGLILLLCTGNPWLLLSSGPALLLRQIIKRIIDYYFIRSGK